MMVNGDHTRSNPTVQILDWDCRRYLEDPTAQISPSIVPYEQVLASLQRYLPSNRDDGVPPADGDSNDFDSQADAFSGNDFRMFEFKVRKCAVVQSHDWTACPYAHPGEKARRRDPRRYHYSGSACPDFRRGACERGDACEYAHGVFECWLHPARYRTQACKDGTLCRRRVCFFAHTPEQLRLLPHADCADNSPRSGLGHKSVVSTCLLDFSPKSTLYYPPSLSPATASPPSSPSGSMSLKSVDQLSDSLRFLQLSKMRKSLSLPASSSLLQVGSRRSPAIPITVQAGPRRSFLGGSFEEEPLMERVESGRELREKIYAKIGEENSLDRVGRVRGNMGASPEFGWDNS